MIERSDVTLDSWVVAGARPHGAGAPLNTPAMMASTFRHGGEFEYSRDSGTETIVALEELVGGMERGHGIAFASGMAAVAAVFDTLPTGAHVVLPDDCYQGVAGLAADGAARGRWTHERLPVVDTDRWVRALGEADLVWLESPSNPLLSVADLRAICAGPRKPGNIVAVDNTFATPVNQRPLELGADVAMHSVTKFIGGHSDLLAGVLVVADESLANRLRRSRVLTGAIPGALEAYLAVRGARTLTLRLAKAQATALALADRLVASPHVATVRYPGLASDPNHDVASRVLDGFGAMVSFDVVGSADDADRVCRRLRLITNATSLGGVESTIERRAAIPGQEHLPPTLLRLSVGCEDVDDLWADLERAFESG